MSEKRGFDELIGLFEQTHSGLKREAVRAVNSALVVRNWLFGWYIVEFEQLGFVRAEYGTRFVDVLSKQLKNLGIRGCSTTGLRYCRTFYQHHAQIRQTVSGEFCNLLSGSCLEIQQTVSGECFPQVSSNGSGQINQLSDLQKIWQTLSAEFPLSWSHYVFLMAVKNESERAFYEKESTGESWSLRELKRQFDSGLYERLALSRDKDGVRKLADEGQVVDTPRDLLKSPYVLEFLGLDEKEKYSESDLETAIIDKLEHFLLELGKGFLFEARQKRFTFDEDHYFVDLVFYNRLLRCYTLIDLKIGELTHQDLGQMQMYVNYYDRHVKLGDENPTVGIVICKKKKEALVEITLPQDSNIHASEYMLYLPSKEELKNQVEESLQSRERSV